MPHLSYVGDAVIGEGTNIGAATVFVNYDGLEKHATVVGDHVRIGSDTMLIAPVTIGDGAYTAAGSVIDQDVRPGPWRSRGAAAQHRGLGRPAPSRVSAADRRRQARRSDEASRAVSPDPADTAQSEQAEPTTEHKGQGA